MKTLTADKWRRVTLPGIKPGQVFAFKEYPEDGEIRLAKLKEPVSKRKRKPDSADAELAAHWDQFGPAPDYILPHYCPA